MSCLKANYRLQPSPSLTTRSEGPQLRPSYRGSRPFNPYGCQIRFRTNHTAATCKFRYQSSLTTTPQALSHSLKNLSLQSPSEAGWVVDTGATNHISEDFSNLSNLKPYTGSSRIVLGDGTSLPITHVGSACIASSFGNFSIIKSFLVPRMKRNLLSVPQLTRFNATF